MPAKALLLVGDNDHGKEPFGCVSQAVGANGWGTCSRQLCLGLSFSCFSEFCGWPNFWELNYFIHLNLFYIALKGGAVYKDPS